VQRIGIRTLKEKTSEIMRRVREDREPYEVTYHGRAIARIVPVEDRPSRASLEDFWKEWDEFGEAISKEWPAGVSAVDAVREQRRELQ
jgi:prevent-host-death family protein